MKISETDKKLMPKIKSVIKSVFLSYVITLVMLAVLAGIITYTPVPSSVVSTVVVLITIASVLLSGFTVAKKNNSRGWTSGAVTGFIYIIILYFISHSVFLDVTMNANFFAMLGVCILSGTVGGIIGVNN